MNHTRTRKKKATPKLPGKIVGCCMEPRTIRLLDSRARAEGRSRSKMILLLVLQGLQVRVD